MHKSLLRTFGLALMAALSLMAFSAVAAQAENLAGGGETGNFLVLGLSSLVANTLVTGKQLGAGKLLIPDFTVYIKCEAGDVNEGKGLNGNEILAKVTFLTCDSYEEKTPGVETEVPACKVVGSPGGELTVTATGIAKAKLHGEELFVLIQPEKDETGKELNFTTLKFSNECAFGATVNIKGSVVALVHNGNVSEERHLILFNQAIQQLFQVGTAGDHLKFGAHESYIDAEADVELTGAHKGCGWAVD